MPQQKISAYILVCKSAVVKSFVENPALLLHSFLYTGKNIIMAFLWIHVPISRIWYSNLRKCYIKMLYISYKFTIMKEVLIIMWIADGWKEYEVIDTSKGEKLERWFVRTRR